MFSKGFLRLQGSLGKSHLSQPLPRKFERQQVLFIVQILLNCLSKSGNKLRNVTQFFFFLFYEKTQELSFPSPLTIFLHVRPAVSSSKTGASRLVALFKSFTEYPWGWGPGVNSAATAQLAPVWSCSSPPYRAHTGELAGRSCSQRYLGICRWVF